MTFNNWIRSAKAYATPNGDFIRDCRDMLYKMPPITEWSQLKDFLTDNRACREALEAAERVWKLYVRSVRNARS